MYSNRILIIALGAFLAVPLQALAGDAVKGPAKGAAAGDYQLLPAEGQHLKVDRATGRVSLCEARDGNWRCELIPDDREAYDADIIRLEAENADLKKRIAELEGKAVSDNDHAAVDDLEKLDRFMEFSDKAIRRFHGLVDDMKKDGDLPECT